MKKIEFSAGFRIWHWLTVLSVFGALFTVLLRSTFLDKKAVAGILTQKLAAFGVHLDPEQAIGVAKAIRAPMWEWHYIFALGLGAAIALRLLLMATGRAELPLLKVLRAPERMERFKATIHLLICLAILVIALTGALYYYHDALGLAKESVHWAKELHEALLWPLVLLIAAHIGGVIRYELTTKECLVSRMIHGDEVRC